MKKQVVFIHGGEAFATYTDYIQFLQDQEYDPYEEKPRKWKLTLADDLGEGYEVIMPTMPSGGNAKYQEWKIWFEKLIPYLRSSVVLVGHSLGGIFLAKYLAENTLPTPIKSLHLIAAPFDDSLGDYSLADFVLPESLELIEEQCNAIHLYHSTDDFVVPYADVGKYKETLPTAEIHTFEDRNHFLIEKFPELLENIRKQ